MAWLSRRLSLLSTQSKERRRVRLGRIQHRDHPGGLVEAHAGVKYRDTAMIDNDRD